MRGYVAGRTAVGVIPPGAAELARPLQDHEVLDAGLAQPDGHPETGEPAADDGDPGRRDDGPQRPRLPGSRSARPAPPRKQGRVGFFDDSHLARLKLIGQLLERGYTFAHITELTAAFERGRDIGEVLGLEQVLTVPWSDEIPDYVTADALAERFGPDSSADTVAQAVRAGLLEPEGPVPRAQPAAAQRRRRDGCRRDPAG